VKPFNFKLIKKILYYMPLAKNGMLLLYNKILVRKFDHTDKALSRIFVQFCSRFNLNSDLSQSRIEINDLDASSYDQKTNSLILKFYRDHEHEFSKLEESCKIDKANSTKIAVLFTELYTIGGHTPLVERFVRSFRDEYALSIFSTRMETMINGYCKEKKESLIRQNNIAGVNWNLSSDKISKLAKDLFNQIIKNCVDIVFCFIHPHDIVASSTLALLKSHSNIKIIFINIQDHMCNLGLDFAHLIIDARPVGQDVTKKNRGFVNTLIMPLQQEPKEATIYYSREQLQKLRNELKIKPGEFFTLTGCAGYKIFGDQEFEYLLLIRELLLSEPKLKHVLMSELNCKQQKIFDSIFSNNKELLKRFLILPRVSDFDIYMQACDLFIDSFPQGGALIHIDMMRNKKPTVVKINKENPIRSFEYYLPQDYEFMYANTNEMKDGVLKLLYSRCDADKTAQKLYHHYLNNYEFYVVKSKYNDIIENYNNLKKFYQD
jgi:hypothetical protein